MSDAQKSLTRYVVVNPDSCFCRCILEGYPLADGGYCLVTADGKEMWFSDSEIRLAE